jgi:MFS family permease
MSSFRWLAALCLASVMWAFSFGVNAPLASLWMKQAGCSEALIGLNTGVYYLGIALTAAAVPWAMRRLGPGALLAGMAGSAVTAAAFPWGGGLPGWFALRLLNGAAAALSLVPLETFVNRNSPEHSRARNFGIYAFSIALGMALGNVTALQLAEDASRLAFLLGGLAAALGTVVVLLWRPVTPADPELVGEKGALHLGRDFLAFSSGWAQGFLEGGMVAFLPIYLLAVGLSHDAVSWLMGGLMIGVILAQAPLAALADRLGRAAVLAGCNAVALLGISCLLWTGGTAWLAFWLFVVGACSGALYPLGLALLGERTDPAGLSRAGACFLAVNCGGSLVGPIVAGAAMHLFGREALFVSGGGALLIVLGGWAVQRAFCPARRQFAPATEAPARAAA